MTTHRLPSLTKIPSDFAELPLEMAHGNFLEAFAHSVNHFPGNIAVTSNGQQVTYHELDKLSNAMAGVVYDVAGKGKSPVAFLLPHDIGVIVALLGILKTGRPYIGLDSSFPADRIDQILLDAQADLILYDASYASLVQEVLQQRSKVKTINVDDVSITGAYPPPAVEILRGDPCLIFYTSGSTGKPKGVIWNHSQLISNAIHHVNDLKMSSSDRCMFISSAAFASSRMPIYDPLVSGGRISMFDVKKHGLNGLREWMDSEQVTLFRGGVQIFRTVFSEAPQDFVFTSLRAVGLGGQPSVYDDVVLCRQHTPLGCVFVHSYVNSEIGVMANYFIDHETVLKEDFVPVGYSLPDKEIHLVNENGRDVVAAGDEGEIVIRANFDVLGYINQPELNAEKYKKQPDGSVLYFTGDLGRWNEDGLLEHHGRKDDLVKIRGYHVKLSEIETVLRKHPQVKDVAILTVVAGSGGRSKQLAAYIVPMTGVALSVEEVHAFVTKTLPRYMDPTYIVFLDALPMTANRKLDKGALPSLPKRSALQPSDLPANETETTLVDIWKRILKVDMVGVHDNFFELGGDSLLAMQLLLEMEKAFSKRLPLVVISRASNISEQAAILRNEADMDFSSVLVPIQASGRKKPVFCIGGKGGNPIRFQSLLKYFEDDRPVYFFRSRGFVPGERIEKTIEEIAAGYLLEVERIQQEGPYYFIGESGGGAVAYEMAQQLLRRGKQTGMVAMLDTYLVELKLSERPPAPDPFSLLRKHVQTLSRGGVVGWVQYYMDLWKYKYSNYSNRRRMRQLGSKSGADVEIYERVEQANISANRAYKPKSYPGCVVMISAARQTKVGPPDHGWPQVGIQDFHLYVIDCYHGNILFEPFVEQVANSLIRHMDESL